MLCGVTLTMQSVVIQSVVMLSFITQSMQNVAMPFSIMLNVIMLNVAAPALTVGPGTALLRKEIATLMICYAR